MFQDFKLQTANRAVEVLPDMFGAAKIEIKTVMRIGFNDWSEHLRDGSDSFGVFRIPIIAARQDDRARAKSQRIGNSHADFNPEEFSFVTGGDNYAIGHQNRSPAKFGSHHLFDGREKTVHSHMNDMRITTRTVHRPPRFEHAPVLCQADGIACKGYSFGTNFHIRAHEPSG